MTMKIVLFNGPPGCGKDTAADYVADEIGGIRFAFATPLKEAVCALHGFDASKWRHYDRFKDRESEEFFGKDLRKLQIAISEQYMKVQHDRTVFARVFYRRLKQECPSPQGTLVCVSDCGFQEEVDWLYAQQDVKLHLIHIIRPNYGFDGDSRGYVQPRYGMYFSVITNDKDLEYLKDEARTCVYGFLDA